MYSIIRTTIASNAARGMLATGSGGGSATGGAARGTVLGAGGGPTNSAAERAETAPWLVDLRTASTAASGARACWPDLVAPR